MAVILPKDESKDFELIPSGSHVGICYRVIDLGTQMIEYQGSRKQQRKIMLSWEFPEERMSDDRPFSIHKRYTLSSSSKSTLRKDLEAWRGVAFSDADFGSFDIGVLLGKPCLLGIVHNTKDGTTYANISSLMRLPKSMNVPSLVNETIYFSLNEFKQAEFEKLSDNLKAIIARSPEYQELMGANKTDYHVNDSHDNGELNDDIPF